MGLRDALAEGTSLPRIRNDVDFETTEKFVGGYEGTMERNESVGRV